MFGISYEGGGSSIDTIKSQFKKVAKPTLDSGPQEEDIRAKYRERAAKELPNLEGGLDEYIGSRYYAERLQKDFVTLATANAAAELYYHEKENRKPTIKEVIEFRAAWIDSLARHKYRKANSELNLQASRSGVLGATG